MEFRMLGPLEVIDDGEPVAIGGRKHQVLLALLLVNANRVVTTDRLLDELWGDDADGKENALWVYISRLRTALGGHDILVTRDHGYSLAIDPERIDAHRFERLVAEGRAIIRDDPSRASQLLGDALALWRGPALEEFAYDDFARAEIVRLDELRSLALEDRIEAELQMGRSGELISELEALQREYPTRERVAGQLMLALYRAGRQTDALLVFQRYRAHLVEELGVEPSPELRRLEEQILLHDSRLQARRRHDRGADEAAITAHNPFKGLHAFREDDSGDFFGRDRIVAEAIRRLDIGTSLLGLVGPSGSGKSSIVRAGLVPALRKGAIEGSEGWLFAQMVPGSRPFAELEAALLRSSLDAPDSLSEQLADRDTGMLRAVLRVLPSDSARLLLVIDQFEELFTQVAQEGERARFLTGLLNAIDDSRGRVMVVITLRADFYDRPLRYPEFGTRLGDGIVNVVPLTSDELEQAAQQPAERAGVTLEPALVAALLTDVIGRPGALPLFQYTLTELFDRRVGDTLTLAGYQAMEGIAGALTRRADDLFTQLDQAQQAAAKQLFLRLVSIGDADEWTRRRVPASEILSLDVDVIALQAVIDAFSRHRLLILDRDAVTDAPTVEVAHEALLTNWPLLHDWIEAAREDVKRHVSLTAAMTEWREAERNPDYLLTGARLDSYWSWSATATMLLTVDEHEYLDTSIQHQERSRFEAEQQLQEGARAARAVRRKLFALAAVAVLVVGGSVVWAVGLFDSGPGPTVAFFGFRDDNGWNANIAAGLDRADQELEMVLVNAPSIVDPGKDFRTLAETGPDIVISDQVPEFAAPEVFGDFPDIRFGVVEGGYEAPNVVSIGFRNEQGGFLAGAAAAMKSESGIVGFIGGRPLPGIEEFRAGFEAGAHSIDPGVKVLATYVEQPFLWQVGGYVNAFGDVYLGAQRATTLYQAGADVVFHAAGYSGFGLFDAVVEQSEQTGRPLWAIGVDNDQWFTVPQGQRSYVLTSIIKRGDVAAYELVEHMLRDDAGGELPPIGIAEGAFDYSTQGDGLTDAMIARLEQIEGDIAAGAIVVPTVPTGEILNTDPAQNLFEQQFSDLPVEQLRDFTDRWMWERYPDDVTSECFAGSEQRMQCFELLVSHRDEYLAEQ